MTTARKIVFAAAVALGLAVTADTARAQYGCNGPMCNQPRYPKYPTLGAALFGNHQPLPTFQAAPWYTYWPYDAHFQTPAPVHGPWYGPPGPGNFPVNPYFPAPQYGPYGPIPGGGAPWGYAPPQGYGPQQGYAPPQAGPYTGPMPMAPAGPLPAGPIGR